MASILSVYSALKDISNKEQKGFINPNVFNSFAPIAQMNVYNEIFAGFELAKQKSRANIDPGRDRSQRKMVSEDVAIYLKESLLRSISDNRFRKPEDLGKVVSIRVEGDINTSDDRTLCEIVYDAERMNAVLGSNLSTPTNSFPVAMVGMDIELFPDTVKDAYITYYALPTSYDYGTTNVSVLNPQISLSNGVINPNASRDFMLPKEYEPEVLAEMCKLLGVRLRDNNLQQFGLREEASES
tara:strand:+ start:2784 stop:3506 length:723 start_codon:yes stop_codon:yes gene_type:complete